MLARILIVVVSMTVCALAQSQPPQKPATNNSSNAVRGRENQPSAQPPINVTVTSPQPSPEATQRDEDRQERNIAAQEDIRDFTRALTGLTFIQAAIAFFALWTTILQRRALIAAERAYAHVADFKISDLEVGKTPLLNFHIWNSGRTPARSVSTGGSAAYGNVRPEQPTTKPTETLRNMFIPAGKSIGVPIKLPCIETAQTLDAIKKGGLWVFIEVRYKVNGMRKERKFQICLEYSKAFQDMRLSNTSAYHYEN